MSTNKGITTRTFLGVVYPDSETYDCSEVLAVMMSTFDECAYSLHDSDVDKNGDLKKPHVHWIGKYSTPKLLSTQSKKFGIPENSIEPCRNWRKAVRYLIHLDDPDKYQYPPESITADFPLDSFLAEKLEEIEKAKKLAGYVIDNHSTSMSDVVKYAIANDCWDTLRRAGSIWSACIAENRAGSITRIKDQMTENAMAIAETMPVTKFEDVYQTKMR